MRLLIVGTSFADGLINAGTGFMNRARTQRVKVTRMRLDGKVRLFLIVAGAATIVAFFFFGTLIAMNYWDVAKRNALRAEDAKSLKVALERYHATKGSYPPFPDNPVGDLKEALVAGGYLRSIPQDPLWPAQMYRYTTNTVADGSRYGLLFSLEEGGGGSFHRCLTGVGTSSSGWWGQPPDCPF